MDHSRNCGGYALNIKQWITPWYEDELEGGWTREARYSFACSLYHLGLPRDKVEHAVLLRDKECLLEQFPFLRAVDSIEHIARGTRIIAYRIFIEGNKEDGVTDYDFHFKQRRKGWWYEKNGAKDATLTRLEPNKPWPTVDWNDDDVDGWYTSGILYFVDTRYSK